MPPTRHPWVVVFLLALVSFVAYFLRTSITVAQEQMAPAVGLTFAQMGTISAWGFQLAYAVGQVPSGLVGDRLGARRVLGLVLIFCAVASFATGLIPATAGVAAAFASLLATRALLGAAQSAVYPVGAMAIAEHLPGERRAFANAIFIGAAGLATALVPLTLAPLMVKAGWRAVFHAGGVLALILAVAWYRWAPVGGGVHAGAEPGAPRRTDLKAALGLLRDRNIFLISLSYLLHSATFFVFVFWFFRYLVDRRGMTILASGLWGSVPWFTAFAIMPWVGWLADRLSKRYGTIQGRRVIAITALLLAAVLINLGARAAGHIQAIAALSLALACIQSCEGPFWAVGTTIGSGHAGTAGGILNLGGNLGGVVSIWAVPRMTAAWGWEVTFGVWAGVAAIAALLWLGLRESGPGTTSRFST